MSKSPDSGKSPVTEVLKHVPALDGVRGLAVSLVLCLHIFWSNTDTPNHFGRILAQITSLGWIGVDLFFVLFGFLITGILFDLLGDRNYFKNLLRPSRTQNPAALLCGDLHRFSFLPFPQ